MACCLRLLRQIAPLAMAAIVAGCGNNARHYNLPDANARRLLLQADSPFDYIGAADRDQQSYELADGTVVWVIYTDDKKELLRMTALAVPGSNGGTDVTTAVIPGAEADKAKFDKLATDHPAVLNFFKSVLDEDVDAVLTGRKMDMTHTFGAMGLAMASMTPEMRKKLDASDAQRDQDNVNRAYANDGRGGGYAGDDRSHYHGGGDADVRTDGAPGEPMVDPKGIDPNAPSGN